MSNQESKVPQLIKELREEEELENQLPVEEDLDEKIKESLGSSNYNDRADGYGAGEAECRDEERAYEKDEGLTQHCKDMGKGYRSHKGEPYSYNLFGLRNQYGRVDQYSFRDTDCLCMKKKRRRKKN